MGIGTLGTPYPTFTAYVIETGEEVVVDDRTFNPAIHTKDKDAPAGDGKPLERMKKDELLAKAAELEIDFGDNDPTKAEIIEAIEEALTEDLEV